MSAIIFLDYDGVLNSDVWTDAHLTLRQPIPLLDPVAVARLERIIQATHASIVLSTSHRLRHPDARQRLEWSGCTGVVIGSTPYLGASRGHEITRWLTSHDHHGPVCILDDADDMGDLTPHLVRTDPAVGLQDADVERAIALLGGSHDWRSGERSPER